MDKYELDSSVLKLAEYELLNECLTLTFHNGDRYAFEAVPANVVQSLITAPSSGQAFNKEIRNNYKATKL